MYSTIGVITIHSCGNHLYSFQSISYWWWANIFDSLSRSSIPLFFMLSGAFLIGKNESFLTFIKKRILKVLIPYILWSVLYLLLMSILLKIKFSLTDSLKMIVTGSVAYHFWFVKLILLMYMLVPFLNLIQVKLKVLHFVFIILIWFLLLFYSSFNKPPNNTLLNNILEVYKYAGYFLLGSLINKNYKKLITYKALIIGFFILSILITVIGTYYLSFRGKAYELDESLYNYYSPNVIIMSVSMFALFRMYPFKKKNCSKFVIYVFKYGIGIFFIHVGVKYLLNMAIRGILIGHLPFYFPWLSIIVNVVIILLISFLSVFLISKIPILKLLTPSVYYTESSVIKTF